MGWRKIITGICLVLLAAAAAHAAGGDKPQELRAIWVTRWNYKSAADIEKIMQNIASANFNAVLFQARGNATTFFQSDLEPWAEELGGADPGWDPLAVAIEQARAHGLQLHVWVNVGPGWRGTRPPAQAGQLWNQHLDWFGRDSRGNPQRLNSHYVWLAITNPEARRHVQAVMADMVRRYQPDGIHFDYIRYPGPGLSYDPVSLRLFRQQSGGTPNEFPQAWDRFRRQALSGFLQGVRDSLASNENRVTLSAAVWRDPFLGRNVFMQDALYWLRSGRVDWLFTMTYTANPSLFSQEVQRYRRAAGTQNVFPGINPGNQPEALTEIARVRELGFSGHSLYSYTTLFPGHKPSATAKRLRKDFYKNRAEIMVQAATSRQAAPLQISTWPAALVRKQPFLIFVTYRRDQPPQLTPFVEFAGRTGGLPLEPQPGTPGTWLVPEAVTPPDSASWIAFRIGTPTGSDTLYSAWQDMPVGESPAQTRARALGPLVGGAQFIAADAKGNAWVPSWWENKIYVLRPGGSEMPFSPLGYGLDEHGNPVRIYRPAGIAALDSNTILLVGTSRDSLLFRFSTRSGMPLTGLRLPFQPADVSCSKNEIFATESGSGTWHHAPRDASQAGWAAVSGEHYLRSIAVTHDGNTVACTCQTHGTVHRWQRQANSEGFMQIDDLPVRALTIGTVDVDSAENFYVCHTGRGFITVFAPDGELDRVVHSERPLMRGPRGVAVTPRGLFVTQMGGTTGMPVLFFANENSAQQP